MNRFPSAAIAAFAMAMTLSPAWADGDPVRGQRAFGACAACHSLEPDRNMTGPSLSGLWNRKAGRLPRAQQPGGMGGMMGMGSGTVPNLNKLDPEDRVRTIARCRDTYRVTTADGKTRDFWERNLRFKTDSSNDGPEKGAPAIVPAGMMGDRADVILAGPEEISQLVRNEC